MFKTLLKSLILGGIAVISGWALSVTYMKTKPRIDAYVEEEAKRLRKEILPQAVEFEKIALGETENFAGYDEKGMCIGVCMSTRAQGYSGQIEMLVGFNMEGEITGIKILHQTETPGLGSRITEEWFLGQFLKLKEDGLKLKKDDPNGKIEAITAATISSRAVVEGAKKLAGRYSQFREYIRKKNILRYIPDGDYIGEGSGFNGPIRVVVSVRDHKLVKMIVLEQKELAEYWAKVKESIPSQILTKQDINVDQVSGATYSSKGLVDAIMNALEERKTSPASP